MAAKEHNKYDDNVDKATAMMTEMTALATMMAATHGNGNHVYDKKPTTPETTATTTTVKRAVDSGQTNDDDDNDDVVANNNPRRMM